MKYTAHIHVTSFPCSQNESVPQDPCPLVYVVYHDGELRSATLITVFRKFIHRYCGIFPRSFCNI
jgi:hypothetical protein